MWLHLTPVQLILILLFTFLAGAWTYRHFNFEIDRFLLVAGYWLRRCRRRIAERLRK